MTRRHVLVITLVTAFVVVACGKKGPSEDGNILGDQTFEFQVIKSPLTGKCYEAVSHYDSRNFQRIFEVSCDFYKPKQ